MPMAISVGTKVKNAKRGCVILRNPTTCGIKIGFGGISSVPSQRGCVDFGNGVMEFEGTAQFCQGVIIKNKGHLTFGDGFAANKNCSFSVTTEMTFGRNCLLGWNIKMRDSDGHEIWHDDAVRPITLPLNIGDLVWIASECHIIKGAKIPDGCVLGYGSLLNKPIEEPNCLIAGHPADIKKHNIIWKK